MRHLANTYHLSKEAYLRKTPKNGKSRDKGPNIAGVDPLSGRIVRLFHPRKDRWARHFIWNGPVLVGQTRIGRATIAVLEINHPEFVAWREVLVREGKFPF